MSEKSSEYEFRVGLFGIGLDTYWPQFEGLRERLSGYLQKVAQKLQRPGVQLINLGLVDTPEKAIAAGHQFRREDVDLIFLYVTTYALWGDRLARRSQSKSSRDPAESFPQRCA